MASAAVERAPPMGGLDDPAARAVRDTRRVLRAQKAAAQPSSSSRPRDRDGLDDDIAPDEYISPDSDAGSQEDEAPRRPAAPDAPPHHSPPRHSPPRQRPQPVNSGNTVPPSAQWGGPSSPSRSSRPPSYTGDDERRFSTGASSGRYRRSDKPSSSRPPPGAHPSYSQSSSAWPKTRPPEPSTRAQAGPSHSRRPSHSSTAMPDSRLRGPPDHTPAPQQPPQNLSRLESPSIAKSVLQPLEKKMAEYDRLMDESQTDMARLDDELRILQERRREAEERFIEAKTKHDDYERQHQDVERALRGEIDRMDMSQTQQHPYMRPLSVAGGTPGVGHMDTVESFDRRPVSNQTSKQSSRSRKLGTRDRIRRSLFGGL